MKKFFNRQLLSFTVALLILTSLLPFTPISTSASSSNDILNLEMKLKTIIENMERNIFINNTEKTIKIASTEQLQNTISNQDMSDINSLLAAQGIQINYTKDSFIKAFEAGITEINTQLTTGDLEMLNDGVAIDAHDDNFYLQGRSTYDVTYWWGKKRYKSTAAASSWVYALNSAGNANVALATIGGVIFGGVTALPAGLSAVYCYQLANSVSYRNSLNKRGIIADITWALAYSTSSQ